MKQNYKSLILGTVEDLVSKFLYYDRKNDEDLRVGDIDKAIENGYVSTDEIVEVFKEKLLEGLRS
jgi:hypothetical protein